LTISAPDSLDYAISNILYAACAPPKPGPGPCAAGFADTTT
jgi:hypothetical protein